MRGAVCDLEAFEPLHSLIRGPLVDLHELTAIEHFVRTVVLHDEVSLLWTPLPYDPQSESSPLHPAFIAVGPKPDFTYGLCTGRLPQSGTTEIAEIPLSPELVKVARQFSNAEEDNVHYKAVHYKAHIEFLQRIVALVRTGGSALLAGKFGMAAIGASTRFPPTWFENLDRDWQQFAREIDTGGINVVVPPVLSIILTRCARQDAIPAVIKDLQAEWTDARAKVWALVDRLKAARTVAEARVIRRELEAASRLLSPTQSEFDTRPGRVLWDLVVGGMAGAATAMISGGPPSVRATVGAVMSAAAKSVPPLIHELGPALFGRGAFDLARRIRQETLRVEYDALARLLTDAEKRKLGL
jgi:hypothetical protein